MFTGLFRVSGGFGRVPRKHCPLQQWQQHRSRAIIPPSSRPGVKKKKKDRREPAAAERSIGPSGSLGAALITSLCFFFFFQGDDVYCCFAAAVAVLFWMVDGWIYWLSFDPPRSAIKSFTLCRCSFACLCFSESAW